jgi:UDP-N-acetylglucosamine acyltransferase
MKETIMNSVDPKAKIGANVTISPFVTISADVEIGDDVWIGPGVVIMDGVRVGRGTRIFPGAILGAIPQDLKFHGENSRLEIGENVTIREYCTLNKGTVDKMVTSIGNNCLLMAYVHVAHDCTLDENVILANNVNLAGHIEIGYNAIIGGLAAVHQFVRIGEHAMVGGGSLVRKDVPPFVKAAREPLSFAGINSIGLRRRGFTTEEVNNIAEIYRVIFQRGYNKTQAYEFIQSNFEESKEKSKILDFMEKAQRGLMKGYRRSRIYAD